MYPTYKEGDLVSIVDGWHDLFCSEGQVGIVMGVSYVSRTLGDGDGERDDPFLFLLIEGRTITVHADAVRRLVDEAQERNT